MFHSLAVSVELIGLIILVILCLIATWELCTYHVRMRGRLKLQLRDFVYIFRGFNSDV